ncbi:extracellular matrix/biofilm biosynthesis regulator RemA family protein [Peptococcaceae bacterium 1198_IL3148]
MFLHLGGDVMVLKKDIIAILDSRTKQATATNEFLEIAKDEEFIKNIASDKDVKSFIITNKEIYLSPISCNTLKKRSNSVIAIDD